MAAADLQLIERIEAKAQKWVGQPFKLYSDAEPMHPYSVLKMLANELREEAGVPITEKLAKSEYGGWSWQKVESP
jgi:hypothetical protein